MGDRHHELFVEQDMVLIYVICGAAAVGLLVYLFLALLKPEIF